ARRARQRGRPGRSRTRRRVAGTRGAGTAARARDLARRARNRGRVRAAGRAGLKRGEGGGALSGPPRNAILSRSRFARPRMNPNFLDFEQPIAELEARIQDLRHASHDQAFNIEDEIATLEDKLKGRTAEIFRNLTPWQIAQVARHPARPYTLDYLEVMCDEFHELAGDRVFGEDPAIVGGLARIGGRGVVVIGHQKGRDTKSKVRRNFGMPRPEGYRKALRLMQMAERFGLPILTFIDTPGAYPGV